MSGGRRARAKILLSCIAVWALTWTAHAPAAGPRIADGRVRADLWAKVVVRVADVLERSGAAGRPRPSSPDSGAEAARLISVPSATRRSAARPNDPPPASRPQSPRAGRAPPSLPS